MSVLDSVSTARAIWRVTDGGLRLGPTLNGRAAIGPKDFRRLALAS